MNMLKKKLINLATWLVIVFSAATLSLHATLANADISQTPLFLTQKADPLMMLAMSNDHELWIKAYTDYNDLDEDGVIDTTYKDSIEYYGYFNSNKCYLYDSGNSRFYPAASVLTPGSDHYCAGSQWSGNFLNWATMTRIDVLRKALYGGKRVVDNNSAGAGDNGLTVLERAYLPHEAHAFAKVFSSDAAEVAKLTPYSVTEISFCNVSYNTSSTDSATDTTPPALRIASGAWPMWAAGETSQCKWTSAVDNYPSNTDNLFSSGADTSPVVRVEVCKSGHEETNCREYSNGTITNKKPVGLLQKYGESDPGIQFGLISGSYDKHISGGLLRKNIRKLVNNATSTHNEIDPDTGRFINQTATDKGIIKTISSFRLVKYNSSTNVYTDCSSPGISVSDFKTSTSNKKCSNWGNPVGEIFLEALRYFTGSESGSQLNATTAFNGDDTGYISALQKDSWSDPLSDANYCAACSILVISTGNNSFDTDELASASDIEGLGGASDVDAKTNIVGLGEAISGSYFIGQNGTTDDDQCSAKSLTNLSDAKGICPETPSLEGGYALAGLAFHARTTDLRPSLTDDQKITTYSMALTRGLPRFEIPTSSGNISLLPACGANSNSNATVATSGWRTCSLVDLQILSLTYDGDGNITDGTLRIQWEDSTWGNDYDMDAVEDLKFCVGTSCSPAVGAGQVAVTVESPRLAAGHTIRMGFTIGGTTNDGIHFPLYYAGSAADYDSLYGSGTAQITPTETFTSGTSTASLLETPLWYAAKWGGFEENEDDANDLPDLSAEWDADNDGLPDNYFLSENPSKMETKLEEVFKQVISTTASASSVVANSVTLETGTHLYQAQFNSGNWTGTIKSFPLDSIGEIQTPDWDAGVELSSLNYDTGRTVLAWDATNGEGISFRWDNLNATQKAALNINPISGATDTLGDERLDYIRGSSSDEESNGGSFRNRIGKMGDIVSSTPYFVGAMPPFNYPSGFIDDADTATYYSTFVDDVMALNSGTGRTPMLYVGSNDGMLHGIDANTGIEKFAYVPNAVISNLNKLTNPNYSHQYYVDGAPVVGDAYITAAGCTTSPCWRTVLVGGLNGGGKAIYALDVTTPDSIDELYPTKHVLWEINSSMSDFSDLGYTYSQPGIVHTTGGWAVVFGNGYSSTNGKAVLYIVDAETGDPIETITLDNTVGGGNGLSTVAPIDADGNRTIDYIYAGDLKGNVWKVDVTSSNTSQWGSAFKTGSTPAPLFTALDYLGVRQPITAQLEVSRHSTGTGFQVFFGTGKYFETGDNNPTGAQRQTFYGIWDKDDGTKVGTRAADLLQQEIIFEISESFTNDDGESFSYDLRVTTDNDINWRVTGATTPNHLGWYIDLIDPSAAVPGERVIHQGFLRGGRIIFTTLIPSLHACDYGGTGWLMELDSESGSRLDVAPWDLNQDGLFNAGDYVTVTIDGEAVAVPPSGKKSKVGIIQKPTVISAGTKEYKYASGSKDAAIEKTDESTSGMGRGRSSWRQLR